MIIDPCPGCPEKKKGNFPSCVTGCVCRKVYNFDIRLIAEHEARQLENIITDIGEKIELED